MASLDVFHQDPFTAIQLTAAVERNPYLPTGLGELDLFDPEPIYTTALMVEQRAGVLSLVPASPRGGAPTERTTELRQARYFEAPRLAVGDTIKASEIQNVRAFGQETELMQVEAEVARRLSGPTGLQRLIEYTWEYHRLAAVQGQLLDASGATLFNWFNEFGITKPSAIAFNLSANTAGSLRPLMNQVVRAMARAAKGAFTPQTEVYGLCGDTFWDELTNHIDVRTTFYNWAAATELRKGNAFEAMKFGGIYWFNYRGSDDASTIAIPANQCIFFPRRAPGVFKVAWAPYESFDFVNTRGKPIYVQPIFDRDRKMWWRMECYSYPLHICTRPEVLQSATA